MFGLTIVKKKDLEGLIIENESLKEEKARKANEFETIRWSWEHRGRLISTLENKLDRCIRRPRGEKGRFVKSTRP
jgi:hypothetical protein